MGALINSWNKHTTYKEAYLVIRACEEVENVDVSKVQACGSYGRPFEEQSPAWLEQTRDPSAHTCQDRTLKVKAFGFHYSHCDQIRSDHEIQSF